MYNLDWQRFDNAAQSVQELEPQTVESDDLTTGLSETDADGVDSAENAIIDVTAVSEIDWLNMTQKLRQLNRDLLKRVSQLQEALGECQEALQAQKGRSQSQEALLTKQNQELSAASEQMTRLFRELESSHQVAQRQQILIETLTQQLELSQERVAQLERECALTQQRYNEQSQQLVQTENTARELRDRLVRQQRHTLQFKAALEKCLDMPPVQYEPGTEESNNSVNTWSSSYIKSVLASQSLVLKAPPIQPWSAPAEIKGEKSDFDANEPNPELTQQCYIEYTHQSEPAYDEDLSTSELTTEQESVWFTDYNLDASIDLEFLEETADSINVTSGGLEQTAEAELSPEINDLSSPVESEPEVGSQETSSEAVNFIFTFNHELSAWHSNAIASGAARSAIAPVVSNDNSSHLSQSEDTTSSTIPEPEPEANLTEEIASETEINPKPTSRVELPLKNSIEPEVEAETVEQQAISFRSTNWPSPVINSQRHAQKRKTYASVQLPKLPPM